MVHKAMPKSCMTRCGIELPKKSSRLTHNWLFVSCTDCLKFRDKTSIIEKGSYIPEENTFVNMTKLKSYWKDR